MVQGTINQVRAETILCLIGRLFGSISWGAFRRSASSSAFVFWERFKMYV